MSSRYFSYTTKGGSRRIRSWVYFTARMLNDYTKYDLKFMEEIGLHAAQKALQDGEIQPNGYVGIRAARYIQREMIRNAAPCTKPYLQQRPDYGYEDGRTIRRGHRVVSTKPGTLYQRRMRDLGLCPYCGKKPETEFRLCNKHRKMAAAFDRKYKRQRSENMVKRSTHDKSIGIIRKMVNNDEEIYKTKDYSSGGG